MIINRKDLTNHGHRTGRSTLLDIFEATLEQLHPENLISNRFERKNNTITIDNECYNLSEIDNVYIVGAGKGSANVAAAIRRRIGEHLTGGIIIEKHGQSMHIDDISVFTAGHPIPDETGLQVSRDLVQLAHTAGENDLIIVCITGGASSQLIAPSSNISVNELASLTETMLNNPLPINEINTVRRHVSDIKGGKLCNIIHPAKAISVVTIDEPAGDPWGPTIPDETTYNDAIDVLRKRSIYSEAPESVRSHLIDGTEGDIQDTPDENDILDEDHQILSLADARKLCDVAINEVRNRGFNGMVLSSTLRGQSRAAGKILASIAHEISDHNRPIGTPCIVVSGGETTVDVSNNPGRGGPNQELALQFGLEISKQDDIVFLSIGTDGTDGPTEIAGGLVDTTTVKRANDSDMNVFSHLTVNNVSPVLEETNDAVMTESTCTNIMDLRLIYIG